MTSIKRKSNQYIGLHLVDTYITDTDPNSEYFRISGIPEIFPGGKTAFRIDGSDLLKVNSEVKVEVLNNEGKVIYSEYPDYIEGSSRMIAVYIYSDELYGDATITIMGEAKNVPPEWQNHLNVRWQKTIVVDPALRNTSPIKFFKSPIISAQELYTPYLIRTYTTSSSPEWTDYTASQVAGQMVGSEYMLSMGSGGVFIRQMEGGILTVTTPNVISGDNDEYQTSIKEVVNANSAIAKVAYSPPDTQRPYLPESYYERVFGIGNRSNTKNFGGSDYTLRYQIEPTYSVTENYKSFAKINIADMETFSGDIFALKLYMKSVGSDRDFDLMGDIVLEAPDLMIDENTVNYDIHYGLIYNQTIIDSFWTSSRSDITSANLSRNNDKIRDALYISGSIHGNELISDGAFTFSSSFWSASGDVNFANNRVEYRHSGSDGFLSQSLTIENGIRYYVEYNVLENNDSSSLFLTGSFDEFELSSSVGTHITKQPAINSDNILKFKFSGSYETGSELVTDGIFHFSESFWYTSSVYPNDITFPGDYVQSIISESFISQSINVISESYYRFQYRILTISGMTATLTGSFDDFVLETGVGRHTSSVHAINNDNELRIDFGGDGLFRLSDISLNPLTGSNLFLDDVSIKELINVRPKDSFYTVYPIQTVDFNAGSEYTFRARILGVKKPKILELVGKNVIGSQAILDIYMSGSSFNDTETNVVHGLGKLVGHVDLSNVRGEEKNFGEIEAAFIADNTGTGHIRFVIPSGDWYISQMSVKPAQETGFSPDNAIFTIPILDWQRDDKLEFKAEFYDIAGKRAETFATSSEFFFSGSNTFIQGDDNLLTGSLYISNTISKGIEISGKRSAYLRNVDYLGYYSASDGTGPSGFMIWSGSVLADINPNRYNGVGFELHGGANNHALRFRTDTGKLELTGSIFVAGDGYFSGSIFGSIITGGRIQTSATGKRVVIDGETDRLSFYKTGEATAVLIIDNDLWPSGDNPAIYMKDYSTNDFTFILPSHIQLVSRGMTDTCFWSAMQWEGHNGPTYAVLGESLDTAANTSSEDRVAVRGYANITNAANICNAIGIWGEAYTAGSGLEISGLFECDDIGVRIMQRTSNADFVDFKVDSSGYLNISASGERIGIGSHTPQAELDVRGIVSASIFDSADSYKMDGADIINSSGQQTGNFKTRQTLLFGYNAAITENGGTTIVDAYTVDGSSNTRGYRMIRDGTISGISIQFNCTDASTLALLKATVQDGGANTSMLAQYPDGGAGSISVSDDLGNQSTSNSFAVSAGDRINVELSLLEIDGDAVTVDDIAIVVEILT